MKLAIGADHAGFELKEFLKECLIREKIDFHDFGAYTLEPEDDYPDFGKKVAEAVSRGEYERGILICGTGIGMSITANKFPGVRAALCWDPFTARISREHNYANILVIGGRTTGKGMAEEILKEWLKGEFQEGRHRRRVEKIREIEKENFREGQ